jgi:hypothetical protein
MKHIVGNFKSFLRICNDISERQFEYEMYGKFESKTKDSTLEKVQGLSVIYKQNKGSK